VLEERISEKQFVGILVVIIMLMMQLCTAEDQ